MTITAGTWQDRAACLAADPELFYPPGTDWAHAKAREATAKAWCAACPVRPECLNDALQNPDQYGIRGGLTPTERDTLHTVPGPAETHHPRHRKRVRTAQTARGTTLLAVRGRELEVPAGPGQTGNYREFNQ